MIEPKVTFKRVMTRGDFCSQYVHEMRWLGEIISHELEKKKVLVEEEMKQLQKEDPNNMKKKTS